MITVHGWTRFQNKDLVGGSDWSTIWRIKKLLQIPVIANGGISCYWDAVWCLRRTKCNGVMSAEGILEYPAIFKNCWLID